MRPLTTVFLLLTIGIPLLVGHYLIRAYFQKQQRLLEAPVPRYVSQEVFDTLPLGIQLSIVRNEGTYLAQRQEQQVNVLLYHMQGQFLCELHQQVDTQAWQSVHTFTDSAPLHNYASDIVLEKVRKTMLILLPVLPLLVQVKA
jgi:hypothetical protein